MTLKILGYLSSEGVFKLKEIGYINKSDYIDFVDDPSYAGLGSIEFNKYELDNFTGEITFIPIERFDSMTIAFKWITHEIEISDYLNLRFYDSEWNLVLEKWYENPITDGKRTEFDWVTDTIYVSNNNISLNIRFTTNEKRPSKCYVALASTISGKMKSASEYDALPTETLGKTLNSMVEKYRYATIFKSKIEEVEVFPFYITHEKIFLFNKWSDGITERRRPVEEKTICEAYYKGTLSLQAYTTRPDSIASVLDFPTIRTWKTFQNTMTRRGCQTNTPSAILIGSLIGDYKACLGVLDINGNFLTGFYYNRIPAVGGLFHSPLVDDNKIIYATLDYPAFICSLSPVLSMRWYKYFGSTFYFCPTLADNDTLYAGLGGSLIALDTDGNLKWTYGDEDWVNNPAVDSNGNIYITCGNGKIISVNKNGEYRWHYTTGRWLNAPPSIDNNDVIYVASNDNYVYAFYSDGTLKWTCRLEPRWDFVFCPYPPVIAPNGMVYVAGNYPERLFAINQNGEIEWTLDFPSLLFYPLALSPNGIIYVPCYDKKLYAVSQNGSILWSYQGGSYWGIPVVSPDGAVYIGNDDGYLYVINSNGTLRWRKNLGMKDFLISLV